MKSLKEIIIEEVQKLQSEIAILRAENANLFKRLKKANLYIGELERDLEEHFEDESKTIFEESEEEYIENCVERQKNK